MKTKLIVFTLLVSSLIPFSQNAAAQQAASAEDETAIKKVIEGETTAMYARDFKTSFNYWANVSYVSRVSTAQEGSVTKITGEELRKMGEQYAAQNPKLNGEKPRAKTG